MQTSFLLLGVWLNPSMFRSFLNSILSLTAVLPCLAESLNHWVSAMIAHWCRPKQQRRYLIIAASRFPARCLPLMPQVPMSSTAITMVCWDIVAQRFAKTDRITEPNATTHNMAVMHSGRATQRRMALALFGAFISPIRALLTQPPWKWPSLPDHLRQQEELGAAVRLSSSARSRYFPFYSIIAVGSRRSPAQTKRDCQADVHHVPRFDFLTSFSDRFWLAETLAADHP